MDETLLRELREAARRKESEPLDPALVAPLGPDFHSRVADRILSERRGEKHVQAVGRIPSQSASRRARVWGALGAFAAAAAFAAALGHPWTREPGLATLPTYSVSVQGGEDSERGPGAAVERTAVRKGARLQVLLRPALDVTGGVAVRLFAERSTDLREVQGEIVTSKTGSIRIDGRVGELLGPSEGDVSLVVVVAREGLPLFDGSAVAHGGQKPPPGVVLARVALRVLGDP